MYRRLRSLVTWLICCAVSVAQAQDGSLSAKLEALKALLPEEVQAGKDFVEQELEIDAEKPYVVTVTQTEGTGKRIDVAAARVNLALLRRVRFGSGRGDRLPVTLFAAEESIAVSDEDGDVKYVSDFDLLADDSDNARAIVALVDEILPLARAAYDAATGMPEGAEALRAFIAARVTDVDDGDDEYAQALAFDPADGTGTLTVAGSGNRDRESVYRFILADLQGRTAEIDARSGLVEVTLPALRGREYIELREEGELDFEKEVVFRFEDYDDALLVKASFAALIALADEARRAATASFGSAAEAYGALAAALARTEIPDVSQSLEGECAAVLTRTESGRATEEMRYDFAFGDVDGRTIGIDPGRGAIDMTLSVKGKEKYIRATEDGTSDGYVDDVELTFTSSTDAYAALQAAEYLAGNCPDPVESAPLSEGDLVRVANISQFPGNEDEQSLALDGGEACNYVLVFTERSGSKSEETETHLSLRDLDARQYDLDIRGDKVEVTFGTRRGERVIDVLEGDGDQEYKDEVAFRFADVLTARRFLAGMHAAIVGCE